MNIKFKDHFSNHAADYSQYRPTYPLELFEYLASISLNQDKAWDCATGNGQSAILLANHFSEVIASDASQQQLDNATQAKGVTYRLAKAEDSGIESNSIDLITVAQAFHWFDQSAFIKEVDRVLKKQGILAIWTYNLTKIQDNIDSISDNLCNKTLDEYWSFDRSKVIDGYKSIELPFDIVDVPDFEMETQWNFSQFIGYLCTWSALKKYEQLNGINPIEKIHDQILEAWGDPEEYLTVKWPLSLRVWQKPK